MWGDADWGFVLGGAIGQGRDTGVCKPLISASMPSRRLPSHCTCLCILQHPVQLYQVCPHPTSCRSSGQRVGYADQILGFDCGGQQWVLEVAFPIGSYSKVTSSWRTPNRWGHEPTLASSPVHTVC